MNPITQALVNAKNYLTGTSVVDNASNPASAYNMRKRALQTSTNKAPSYPSMKLQKGQVLGSPPGGPNQLSKR